RRRWRGRGLYQMARPRPSRCSSHQVGVWYVLTSHNPSIGDMSRLAAVYATALALGSFAGEAAAATHSSSLAIAPGGGLIAIANPDSDSLTLVDTTGLAVLAEVPVGRSPRAVAIDADGARAFV